MSAQKYPSLQLSHTLMLEYLTPIQRIRLKLTPLLKSFSNMTIKTPFLIIERCFTVVIKKTPPLNIGKYPPNSITGPLRQSLLSVLSKTNEKGRPFFILVAMTTFYVNELLLPKECRN